MSDLPVNETTSAPRSAAWNALTAHARELRPLPLRAIFAADPGRGDRLALDAVGIYLDYSKNRVTDETLRLLLALADEAGLSTRIDAMFGGDKVNVSENRAALHVALRAPQGAVLEVDGRNVVPEVHEVLSRMAAFADRVRSGAWRGHSGKPIRNVVNIGIGGSDLGPVMAYEALRHYSRRDLVFRFVSNVDATDFAEATRELAADETLFIVSSKTFTTQETMANAAVARAWFVERGGRDIARHFVATTTNVQAAAAFGIGTTFGVWDWVGGRYSLWSAIGLPIAIAIGEANVRALLAGAHAMDRHFAEAPAQANLPLQLGLLDVWYRNFHRFPTRCVAPYHQGLRRLPAYLQQLEMESNGKRVDRDGQALPLATSPVVWGEPGTNGQHAFFQMLHQGTDVVPVEFILVRHPAHGHADLHAKLLANGLAQSQALMLGKSADAAAAERAPATSPGLDRAVLARHRSFPGNRPSTTLVLDALTPRSLGALIALYEHRVFTRGALWGINSFDKWGVELGKALCNQLLPRLASGDAGGLDASTAGLLQRLRR